jgi:Toastrack DUF4097
MGAAAFAAILAATICAGALPARAGTEIDRTLKLAPGGRFVLDSFAGSVSVMGSSESGANVVVTSNRDDIQRDIDFSFEQNPGEAVVRARRRNPWDLFGTIFDGLWIHYDIRVPKNTTVEIRTGGGTIKAFALAGDAELGTSGGSIEAVQLAGNLRAHTSGGNIRAQVIHGEADLATSGGNVEADAVDGPLTAHTSGGSIRISGVAGRVDARTSGGSINAAFDKGDSQGGVLATSGGSIYAKIDAAANLEIDASASGGGVSSSLPLRVWGNFSSNDLHGTLGSGGAVLRLRTSGGHIRLDAL